MNVQVRSRRKTKAAAAQAPRVEARPDIIRDVMALREALHALVWRGVARAVVRQGGPDIDPFRGLHISPEEFCRLLALPADALRLGIARGEYDGPVSSRLTWLCGRYGLSAFERDVLLVAAAPDLDLRYERIYAYLNDDVGRRRATVDLALELLCETAGEKHVGRARLSPEMPLVANRLVHLVDTAEAGLSAADARVVRVDEQVLAWLTGIGGLDTRLAGVARCDTPQRDRDADNSPPAIRAVLDATLAQIAGAKAWSPLLLLMEGEDLDAQTTTANAFAADGGLRVLRTNLDAFSAAGMADLLAREAFFKDALLVVDAHAAPTEAIGAGLRALSSALEASPCLVALACRRATGVLVEFRHAVVPLRFGAEGPEARCVRWRAALTANDAAAEQGAIERVAQRIALPSRSIAAAAATAAWAARAGAANANGSVTVGVDDLQDAARRFARRDLSALATTIVPVATWSKLVSSPDAVAQLREFCARVDCNDRLLGQWGFGRRISYGTGISALFFGPSGTGKTMAAEIIAGELGLDLLKIDLSGVVSKYIGETEKNLEQIFTAARGTPSILFFDEADALFGKRSEVRDSHDRYANVEISYLLQRMEAFEGVTILATNIHQNLDEAFVRRLTFAVHFPFPDAEQRGAIWRGIFPVEVPLDPDVDVSVLARRFPISGGAIKNAALAAAALAAGEEAPLGMRHLLHAVRREYQKMGKSLTPAELLGTVEPAAWAAGE